MEELSIAFFSFLHQTKIKTVMLNFNENKKWWMKMQSHFVVFNF